MSEVALANDFLRVRQPSGSNLASDGNKRSDSSVPVLDAAGERLRMCTKNN